MELPAIAGGTKAALAPIVSTRRSAEVLLKYWHRRYRRMPDLLVIEGPLAGGHLGFTWEQLAEFTAETYDEEIRGILKTVRQYEAVYEKKIPVVLAGGIDSSERAQHAFSIGADAVQAATRFITTEECDADIRTKQAYLNVSPEDIVIINSPVGMPGRAIRNAFTERVASRGRIAHGSCYGCLQKCSPAQIPYCITDALIRELLG